MRRIILILVIVAAVAAVGAPQSVEAPTVVAPPFINPIPMTLPVEPFPTPLLTPPVQLTPMPAIQTMPAPAVPLGAMSVAPSFTYVNISIQGAAGYSTYVATMGRTELARTNDAAHLLTTIATHRSAAGPIYINTRSVDVNRRAALRTSMNDANRARKLPLHYVDGLDVLFSRSAARQTLERLGSGLDTDGYYYERATVTVNGESFTMTVFSLVKAAAQVLMARITSYFNSDQSSSTIAIINAVRRQVASEWNEPENRLYVQFKDQLANTRWVELRPATNPGAR
jgi:hypothetical protein